MGVTAILVVVTATHGAIESNFEEYPGEAGEGWVGPCQHASGDPEIRTDDPIDGDGPYIRLDSLETRTRNFAREYESGAGVDITQPHTIRWKFRIPLDDLFDFSDFSDSVHFYARHATSLTNRPRGDSSWQMWATGTEHSSGASGGQTFWVFDNVDGSGTYNLINNVDTGVHLHPGHIYSVAVSVFPESETFTVNIHDQTGGVFFSSRDPHHFRSVTDPGEPIQTALHFGVQASSADQRLPFDLDSVRISQGVPPTIENVSPSDFSIHPAESGIRFDVSALEPVDVGDIWLTVNGDDVSSELEVSEEPTHRTLHYTGIDPDEEYTIEIGASNVVGTTIRTATFYTASGPFELYDSEGFTSTDLYPEGELEEVTHGRATWVPHPSEPAEIRDVGTPHGNVLERMNTGASRADWLHFPPVSSGTVIVEFDAWVSTTDDGTIDVSLSPMESETPTGLLGWGKIDGKLTYFDGSEWVSLMDLQDGWHHYEIVYYLSGLGEGRFDVFVDGMLVGEMLNWGGVESGTPLGRFRLHSAQSGPLFERGQIDNLVVSAAPEQEVFPPPAIENTRPAFDHAVIRPQEGIGFEVVSHLPVSVEDVSVLLNGADISSELDVSGSENHLSFSYGPVEGGERHTMEISASNEVGTTTTTIEGFFVIEDELLLFDSEGFEDDELFPLGPLQETEGDGWRWWTERGNPSEIVDIGPPHNKIVRKSWIDTNDDRDYLDFPPVASGSMTIRFDARVSATDRRTLDLFVLRPGERTGSHQASILIWGRNAGQLSYFDGSYNDIYELDDQWHRYEMIHDLERNRFDLRIDGEVIGTDLTWRNAFPIGTALGRMRLGLADGTDGDISELDNLEISVKPAEIPPPPLPVNVIRNISYSETEVRFDLDTQEGLDYVVEYSDTLKPDDWTMLTAVSGSGEMEIIIDPDPNKDRRFYRVRILVEQ